MTRRIFAINPHLDRVALAAEFATNGRIQVRDVLEVDAARNLRDVLARDTPWGIAWNAGSEGPRALRREEIARLDDRGRAAIGDGVSRAARAGEYAFTFARYPMLDAYTQRWAPDGPHDIVLEHINDQPFLDLARDVTGIRELRKADAQATLFVGGHFLAQHSDSHVGEGWRVAYVLSLAPDDWKPDWGGYLNFFDADGDVVAGYRPRFNALNMFAVPALHSVSYVPPFAPVGRFSITGWLRDR